MKSGNSESIQSTAVSRRKAPIIAVYSVTCHATGKSYIGWSSDTHSRLSWHRSHLRNGKHSRREMLADFVKHGETTFSFVIIAEFKDEVEAVREEARLIGEAFKAGSAYNGVVPNAVDARPRAKTQKGTTQGQPKKAVVVARPSQWTPADDPRTVQLAHDVMLFLRFLDQGEFLRCVDAFLDLAGMEEEEFSLAVTGYPKFLYALRRGKSGELTLSTSKKFRDYILSFMHERDRLKMAAERAARKEILQRKAAA